MNNSKDHDLGHFLLGNGCILLATIFWGVNIPVTKALIPDWMTSDGITAVRLLGGCALFWIASLFIKCQSIEKGDWSRIILGGGVGLFAFIYLLVISLRYGSAIDVSIIITLPPMFVILMGIIFMGQRPALTEYAGIVISFIGAVIVIAGGGSGAAGSDMFLGDMLAIASSFCYAFYLVILQKPSRKYRPLSLLRWIFLFSGIPALFLLPGFQDQNILRGGKIIPWMEILFILFCPTFIAYFLVQPAIKNIGSELVSLYQYLLPVAAAIAAVLMGMEKITIPQVAAMLAVVAGMVLTNIGKRKRVKKMAVAK